MSKRNPNKESAIIPRYFYEITKSKPISREREVQLATRIKEGDIDARNELVEANLRFAVSVAREYQNRGLSLEELIAIANTGLVTAADRFDGTKGFKFISYAVWWIRQAILQTFLQKMRLIYIPLAHQKLLRDVSDITRALEQELGKEPNLEQISTALKLSLEEIKATIQESSSTISMEQAIAGNDERTLGSLLQDTSEPAPDSMIIKKSSQKQMERLLELLDKRERIIIELYFGLNGQTAIPLEKIGSLLHITRERVRQIKEIALSKMRNSKKSRPLREDCASN